MREFEVGGHKYTAGKLDAFKQFHVARRLAGVIPALGEAIPALKIALLDAQGKDQDEAAIGFLGALGPLTEVIASMKDEDADYVLNECLSACKREVKDGTWAPVRSNGVLMYEDIELAEMLQIAWEVLQENLASFMGALPSTIPGTGSK